MKKRFFTVSAIFVCLALLPFSAWAFTYYIPFYENGDGIGTGLALRNLSNTDEAEVSVTVFDQAGTLVQQTSFSLAPNGQEAEVIGDETVRRGWMLVESDRDVAGLCIVARENRITDVPFKSIVSRQIVIPHIAQDDRWDTTVFVANPNDANSNLTVFLFGKDGALLGQESYVLPVLGSERIDVADLFQSGDQTGGSILLEADRGIAAFAIYSDEEYGGFSVAGIDGRPLMVSNFDGTWTGTFTPLVDQNNLGVPCIAPRNISVDVDDRTMTGGVNMNEFGQFEWNGRIDTDGNVSGTLRDVNQGDVGWLFTGLNDDRVMFGDWEAPDGCFGTWTLERQ
jgi:hypothetical protein